MTKAKKEVSENKEVVEKTKDFSIQSQINVIVSELLEKEQNRNIEEAIVYLKEAVAKLDLNDLPQTEEV